MSLTLARLFGGGNSHFLGAFFPEVTGHLLHIFDVVDFVNDLGSEDGLDDVFEGNDAGEGSELVDGSRDVNAVGDHLIEEIGEVLGIGNGVDFAAEIFEWQVAVSLCEGLQKFDAEDEAVGVIDGLIVDRNAREGAFGMFGHVVRNRHIRREGKDDGSRGGSVLGHGVAQAEEVLHDASFGGFDGAFFFANIGHRDEFGTAEGTFLFTLRDATGDFIGHPDERGHVAGELGEHEAGDRCDLLPVHGSEGFRDDLGEDENEEGEEGGNDAGGEGSVAKNFHGLGTDTGRADGVGHGIEDEDGREGAVDVSGELLPYGRIFGADFFLGLEVGASHTEEDGFKDGAKKRKDERDEEVSDK